MKCSSEDSILALSHWMRYLERYLLDLGLVNKGEDLMVQNTANGEAYGEASVGLQGAVGSTVFTNGGLVIRGFIPWYITTRRIYGPTYSVEHTVSSNYYKYFEMNHAVEAFIVLPRGVHTMEGLFTLISWASEGSHNTPIGLLNIDGYFNNLIKFLDNAVMQNFMASN
ncbi:hypothetical protein DM860_000904 [Cuscuta australis]|uniref:cytokinin riboside 5'-monophosphate phosphoribohydrolase n=1 Tax=Cuscuta australis TaxID=267555 RepID=A0A328DSH3_9ASTE|nr:hypothetical protein DM860_000904 [Cuscuta australis]